MQLPPPLPEYDVETKSYSFDIFSHSSNESAGRLRDFIESGSGTDDANHSGNESTDINTSSSFNVKDLNPSHPIINNQLSRLLIFWEKD